MITMKIEGRSKRITIELNAIFQKLKTSHTDEANFTYRKSKPKTISLVDVDNFIEKINNIIKKHNKIIRTFTSFIHSSTMAIDGLSSKAQSHIKKCIEKYTHEKNKYHKF